MPARTDASKLCLFAYEAGGVELAVGRAGSFMFDSGAAAALDDELLELGLAVIDGGLRETTVEDQDGVLESFAQLEPESEAVAVYAFGRLARWAGRIEEAEELLRGAIRP